PSSISFGSRVLATLFCVFSLIQLLDGLSNIHDLSKLILATIIVNRIHPKRCVRPSPFPSFSWLLLWFLFSLHPLLFRELTHPLSQ
ncbi:hypothetical protein PAXRUDRAFT_133053, partial [Paxillus rubicundulus Ve08.2h10]